MVKKIKYKNENCYICETCKLIFKEKEFAKKCEKHCKEEGSCNLKITNHAINKSDCC